MKNKIAIILCTLFLLAGYAVGGPPLSPRHRSESHCEECHNAVRETPHLDAGSVCLSRPDAQAWQGGSLSTTAHEEFSCLMPSRR